MLGDMADYEDIIQLDLINMTGVLHQSGSLFDPELRRQRLLLELQYGSRLIRIQNGNSLVAYLQYLCKPDGAAEFQSVQVHPQYRNNVAVFRKLIRAAIELLENTSPASFKSIVHASNIRSLNMHRKLGFQQTEVRSQQIVFEIAPEYLLTNLKTRLAK
jgi:ribosomal protein S18 acetylase RimI-like enzyme